MIIQKFGGIAMQDKSMRKKSIEHVKAGIKQFEKVVVVVSAIGRLGDPYSTDSLLNLTGALETDPGAKDLVASCGELIAAAVLSAELNESGVRNTILHGIQAGIQTSGDFGDAEIDQIDPSNILDRLETMDCVIIPGFQGMDKRGNVMTLGRGGSDLTAVSLAVALYASHVEFYKDVSGVMTGDPKIMEDYQKIDALNFNDFFVLLNCERPIVQKRAALHAKKMAIPLYIRGIAGTEEGTWITS